MTRSGHWREERSDKVPFLPSFSPGASLRRKTQAGEISPHDDVRRETAVADRFHVVRLCQRFGVLLVRSQ
jgi:hypothetical protein